MIRINLTFKQLMLLNDAHIRKVVPGTDQHADLLREHCADFCMFFWRLIIRGSKKYRVRFTSLQARAFMQLWVNQELPLDPTGYLILELIGEFDQVNKSVKQITAE